MINQKTKKLEERKNLGRLQAYLKSLGKLSIFL